MVQYSFCNFLQNVTKLFGWMYLYQLCLWFMNDAKWWNELLWCNSWWSAGKYIHKFRFGRCALCQCMLCKMEGVLQHWQNLVSCSLIKLLTEIIRLLAAIVGGFCIVWVDFFYSCSFLAAYQLKKSSSSSSTGKLQNRGNFWSLPLYPGFTTLFSQNLGEPTRRNHRFYLI